MTHGQNDGYFRCHTHDSKLSIHFYACVFIAEGRSSLASILILYLTSHPELVLLYQSPYEAKDPLDVALEHILAPCSQEK